MRSDQGLPYSSLSILQGASSTVSIQGMLEGYVEEGNSPEASKNKIKHL